MMSIFGYALWPPIWIDCQGIRESTLRREVGVLRKIRNSPYNVRQIFLTMEHEGVMYTGCLSMQYEFLGEYMGNFFDYCTGMTIETIGSLEIPLAFDTLGKARTGR